MRDTVEPRAPLIVGGYHHVPGRDFGIGRAIIASRARE